MKTPQTPTDMLDAALDAPQAPLADGSFTRGVMERLPPRRFHPRVRGTLLFAATVLGALPLLSSPVRAFISATTTAMAATALAPSASLLVASVTMAMLLWSATTVARPE